MIRFVCGIKSEVQNELPPRQVDREIIQRKFTVYSRSGYAAKASSCISKGVRTPRPRWRRLEL